MLVTLLVTAGVALGIAGVVALLSGPDRPDCGQSASRVNLTRMECAEAVAEFAPHARDCAAASSLYGQLNFAQLVAPDPSGLGPQADAAAREAIERRLLQLGCPR
jgi:hypothetical protein